MKKSILILIFSAISAFTFALDPTSEEYSCKPIKVEASSTLPGDKNNPDKYAASNLADNSWKSWAGKGVGTKIKFDFKGTVRIYGIMIRNGYGSLGYYLKNNRVKSFNLYSDGEKIRTISLKDTPDPRCISFLKSPFESSTVTIEITDIYRGTEFDDTCIAEITFLDNSEYCYNYYKERDFKYDAWRSNLFSSLYKTHSIKSKKETSGRCLVYRADDFEGETAWNCVLEYLHAPVYPQGYRGMGDWYAIFLTDGGAVIVEYEKGDLNDSLKHIYTYDGKTLTDATETSRFKNVKDTIKEISGKDINLRFEFYFTDDFKIEIMKNGDNTGSRNFNFNGETFVLK